ncbi:MAG: hypothetical protein ABFS43_07325 [Thermodesulfobacteriota bacterium]
MLSLILFSMIVGVGILGIFLSMEFWEYLRKYRPKQWESVTYERVFGIPRDDFPVNPIRPLKFIITIFSSENCNDLNIPSYKIKLKLIMISIVLLSSALILIP